MNVNAQTPSPGPYITPDGYGMYTTTRLTSGGPTSTFITEPYYREFYTTANTADTQTGYGQAPRNIVYGGAESEPPHPGTTYEGRFTTSAAPVTSMPSHTAANTATIKNGTPVYAKTITAAGLTVDLPSPDSGIGADTITPRDQNNIHQVCEKWFASKYNYSELQFIYFIFVFAAQLFESFVKALSSGVSTEAFVGRHACHAMSFQYSVFN